MNLDEVFRGLGSPKSRERDAAASALNEAANRLVKGWLTTRGGRSYRVPEPYRDDVVGFALINLARRLLPGGAGIAVTEKGPEACQAYLATTLVNQYLSLLRKERREQLADEPGELDSVAAPEPEPQNRITLEQMRAFIEDYLEPFASRVIEARQARYRAGYARTWRQLADLVFRDVPIGKVLERDEGVGPGSTEEAFILARDRLYTNHCRFRAKLTRVVEDDIAAGRIRPDDVAKARSALQYLARCQNPGTPAST